MKRGVTAMQNAPAQMPNNVAGFDICALAGGKSEQFMDRLTRMIVVGLMVCAVAPLSLAQAPISKISPQYPIRAFNRGEEGWVEIDLTIAADGSVAAPKVVAAAPPGTFNKAALAAVSQWRYPPGAEKPQTVVLTFSFLQGGAARDLIMSKLGDAGRAAQEKRFADAGKILDDLEDDGGLTLFELGALERVKAGIDYRQGRFADAARRYNRLLEIMDTRMNPDAQTGAVESLATARVNAGDFTGAINAVDRWRPSGEGLSAELNTMLASIRSALAAGRPITLNPAP
ncbi:MAG: TonB family protein [Alphaproteobacteria bacterium]|nr:TonB family protein [Alphaproteobacteria bacterium]